jgi:hypothetical protein
MVKTTFEPLVQKVSNIESDVADLKVRMTKVESRLDNLEKNDKIIFDILSRNNLR